MEKCIAPSILSANFLKINDEIKSVEKYCHYLHIDVMDGVFVPNISFGLPILSAIKDGIYDLKLDVHLMIEKPVRYAQRFLDAGADILTVHFEACSRQEINEIIKMCHKENREVGLAIKPKTSVDKIKPFLKDLDLVLIMSVEPGFGGQKYIEATDKKIEQLASLKKELGLEFIISVDGGINEDNARKVRDLGADLLVAGSAVFDKNDRKKAIELLEE